MGATTLSSRSIIGEFYQALEQNDGLPWVQAITNMFDSDQASEFYAWLGQMPVMREWVGSRQAKGFTENGITIENLHFEATIEVFLRELRRDKTGQIMMRVRELANRTNAHWAKLVSMLIIAGMSTPCYDGHYFFDTTHEEGNSGVQSNMINIDISTLPTDKHGSKTNPSVEEMQLVVAKCIQQMFTFLDNEGEPLNETASNFLVMAPVAFMTTIQTAFETPAQIAASQTALSGVKKAFNVDFAINPRFSDWNDKIVVFRTDSEAKPIIRQQETDVELAAVAEGSEMEFRLGKHEYGVDTWRNVGFGMWQHAVLGTMI